MVPNCCRIKMMIVWSLPVYRPREVDLFGYLISAGNVEKSVPEFNCDEGMSREQRETTAVVRYFVGSLSRVW